MKSAIVGKGISVSASQISAALKTYNPNPWGGSRGLQEARLGPQNLMLDLQMVVLQVLQDNLVVWWGPELAQVLLRSPDVQSVPQVLKVHRNVHHIAAEEAC